VIPASLRNGCSHACVAKTAVYAIEDLCLHPEYLEPLREELASQLDGFVKTGQGLPLLDSFIKESARLSPVESRMLDPFVALTV